MITAVDREDIEMETSPNCPLPCLAMVHGVGAEHRPPTATTLFSVADARPLGDGGHGLEEDLKNKTLCPTARGWMLVHDRDAAATTYLLDGESRQKMQLPRLAMDQRLIPYCSCLLLGEPTAAGCLVLLVEPGAAFIRYCRVGDGGEWTKHEYDIGTVGDKYFVEKRLIAPIAACRGRFYFNAAPTETRVLELRPGAEPEFSSIPTEVADADRYTRAMVFMVETEEEDLYKVVLLHHGGSFDEAKVFRMDFSENRWRLVDDLGGRAFFVAPMYFGASRVPVAGDGIRQDCVYSLVGAAKNSFRIFNLKDGTSEVRNLEPYEPMLETVGESRPYWVLPTHPRA